MKKPVSVLLFTLLLSVGFFPVSVSAADAHILNVADGSIVTFPHMIEDLGKVNLVFLGEIHDREADHQAQLQIIRALYKSGVRLAIGLEMFRKTSQNALDRWVKGKMGEAEFERIFYRNWSLWPFYEPIFGYAREKRIPMLGLNISREITRQVAARGFSSLTPKQMSRLPTGVTCTVNPDYRAFIRRALGEHFHSRDTFTHFCEAQMLWDSVMAQNLLSYLKAHPGTTVVVLAGAGHAWKFGIPARIKAQSSYSYRVVLPELVDRLNAKNATTSVVDYLLIGLGEGPLH